MKPTFNILVTGCGGDIGQSIGKILNESPYVNKLYGCDISDKNAGQFIYRNFSLGLRFSDKNYLNSLEKFVINQNIDVIIPVSEPELRFFSKENVLSQIGGAKLITASSVALEIGFDKLKTANFLKENGLPFPVSNKIADVERVERFPVVLKSKTGSGSSEVHLVKDMKSFEFIKAGNPEFIVQEYLNEGEGEFTCGVFRSKKGVLRTMILKRELMGGFSGYGEVVENQQINKLLAAIAEKLTLVGSINVQLRITQKGPVVFEINPRFSSTVRFRQMLGFNDLEWSLEDRLALSLSEYADTAIGKTFYKGFNEYIS